MKKKIITALWIISTSCMLTGCQSATRSMGANTTINLEPNQKLELITWKEDDSLWYLTRPMREDEEAETHIYQQSSEFHFFEGTVTIIETKK